MGDLMKDLEYYNHFFGYAKMENNDKFEDKYSQLGFNKLEFYDYKGTAKKENTDSYMGF